MLFICTFNAIFELAPIVGELFGHFVNPAWHIATDCGPEDHALTDMEFMRHHGAPSRMALSVARRIRPALTIVRDEAPNGHGLHRMIGDVDRAMVNAGCDAEQNHAVRCAELCRWLFHGLLPPPALGKGEGSHCWLRSSLSSAVVWATHGRVIVIAAAALRVLGNSPRL